VAFLVWRFLCGVSVAFPLMAPVGQNSTHIGMSSFLQKSHVLYMAFSVHTYNYACLIWQKGFAVMKGTCQFTQPAGGASMFVKQYFHGFSLLIH